MGHSQWRCCLRQTIPGRHQSSVTCASMRRPPRAVCNSGRARRSTRPPQRGHAKNAQPPRPHREMVQLDPSRELRFTAGSFLRLSQYRYSGRRRCIRLTETRAPEACLGCSWIRIWTAPRSPNISESSSSPTKNPYQGLQRHRRFPERAVSLAKLTSPHPRATRALRRGVNPYATSHDRGGRHPRSLVFPSQICLNQIQA